MGAKVDSQLYEKRLSVKLCSPSRAALSLKWTIHRDNDLEKPKGLPLSSRGQRPRKELIIYSHPEGVPPEPDYLPIQVGF